MKFQSITIIPMNILKKRELRKKEEIALGLTPSFKFERRVQINSCFIWSKIAKSFVSSNVIQSKDLIKLNYYSSIKTNVVTIIKRLNIKF